MPQDSSPRKRLQRIARDQWLEDLKKMQAQIMSFLPVYADGSTSNQALAVELEALHMVADEQIKMIETLLGEL